MEDLQTMSFLLLSICCLSNGVLGGGCGEASIRLRPSLVFEPKHASIYLDVLRKTLKEL